MSAGSANDKTLRAAELVSWKVIEPPKVGLRMLSA